MVKIRRNTDTPTLPHLLNVDALCRNFPLETAPDDHQISTLKQLHKTNQIKHKRDRDRDRERQKKETHQTGGGIGNTAVNKRINAVGRSRRVSIPVHFVSWRVLKRRNL